MKRGTGATCYITRPCGREVPSQAREEGKDIHSASDRARNLREYFDSKKKKQ